MTSQEHAVPSPGRRSRWAGRDVDKDAVRERVWTHLAESGIGMGDVFASIPNFVGAAAAAKRLVADLPGWDTARIVKTNPDDAQAWVRLAALRAGKTLYVPVPGLTRDFPYLGLEPDVLRDRGVEFEDVIFESGYLLHGRPMEWEEMSPMDVFVVGSVAVTTEGARTGKGAGFADLEMGIFRELGIMTNATTVTTTVHDHQVLDDGLPMAEHDTPLNWIFTPTRSLSTSALRGPAEGIRWDLVREDQYRDIPFLTSLREKILAE